MSSWRTCLACGGFALASCGISLPEPAHFAQPASAYVEVPYPPPAGLVELVVPSPRPDAVWVDGRWTWRGREYGWKRGGWLVPPKAGLYAPWEVRYAPDGVLLFAESAWFDAGGQKLEDPTVIASAKAPPNEVTPESQVTR